MPVQFPRRRSNPSAIPVLGLDDMLRRAPQGGSSAVAAAVQQLAAAYQSTLTFHDRASRDATMLPAARAVRSARHARSNVGPAIETLRKARTDAVNAAGLMLQETEKLFDFSGNFAAAMIGAEIRSHFASLPSADRLTAINAAIEAGDKVTLKALGTAPHYLSGLPQQLHTLARDRLIALDPEAQQRQATAQAIVAQDEHASIIEQTLLQAVGDLVDFNAADSFEAAAREATAA